MGLAKKFIWLANPGVTIFSISLCSCIVSSVIYNISQTFHENKEITWQQQKKIRNPGGKLGPNQVSDVGCHAGSYRPGSTLTATQGLEGDTRLRIFQSGKQTRTIIKLVGNI